LSSYWLIGRINSSFSWQPATPHLISIPTPLVWELLQLPSIGTNRIDNVIGVGEREARAETTISSGHRRSPAAEIDSGAVSMQIIPVFSHFRQQFFRFSTINRYGNEATRHLKAAKPSEIAPAAAYPANPFFFTYGSQ